MEQIPVYNHPPTQPSTTTAVGGKIHVRLTQGRYQNIRRLVSGSLLALFFALVWVEVDGAPWLLFDFAQHRITLFGTHFSWSDLPVMAGLMIAGTALLFFMAVGWGRLWCGFACPQSIWTWLFIRIEDLTEGRAGLRRKQEQMPLKGALLFRRLLKHGLWLLLSVATALTFTGYFIPIREMLSDSLSLQLSLATLFWLVTMSALTYVNGGLVREKVCFHMCPYSRFQGVMFDPDTRTVTYDAGRGEPRMRGKAPTPTDSDNGQHVRQGDCVDCSLCVQVCPTGIDIRNGLQYECIDCGACIDACDAVMDKLGLRRGLIAFQSENQLRNLPSPLFRPRMLTYLLIILASTSAVLYGFANRTELLLEVRRDRQDLYQQMSDGRLCNLYHLKLEVYTQRSTPVNVIVDAGFDTQLVGSPNISEQFFNQWQPYRVCTYANNLPSRSELSFRVKQGESEAIKESKFIAPEER